MFQVDNIKNEAILRDFLHLSKVLRLPGKIDAKSYKGLHLSRKIIFANLTIWCSKMQPLSGNQRPDLLTSLMNMSPVLRLPRKMHLSRSSSNAPRLPSFWEMRQKTTRFTHFRQGTESLAPATQNHIWTSKSGPSDRQFWTLLTSKCASRHSVHSFDISTSKSAHRLKCFVHVDFEMCFAPQQRALFEHLNFQNCSERGVLCTFWLRNVLRAMTACTFSTCQLPKNAPSPSVFNTFDFETCFAPQRRALFRHLNFQKWSDVGVFCTFWLPNVLRATMGCNFSTSQPPKAVRRWCALHILTSKCAWRHNVVQFFIFHLARWLRTRRFSEPFWPSGATNHWKNAVFRDFSTFWCTCIFFPLTLSLLWSSLFFSSLLFPDSAHLLSTCPYCRKFDF